MIISQGGGLRATGASAVPTRAFSFRAISPSLSSACLGRFESADLDAQADAVSLTYRDLGEFVVHGLSPREPDQVRSAAAKAAIELVGKPFAATSLISDLKGANAALCAYAEGAGAWRSNAVWVGRVSRDRSVFEGAAPKDIPRLMGVWGKLHDRPMPLSLQLAISSLRLLQIHPFLDGNGRTARWMALHLARRHSMAPNGFDSLVMNVWSRGAAFRHACSASVTQDADWEPWLNAWLFQA